MRRAAFVALLVAGCATNRVAEVRQMGQRGDTPGLVAAWTEADSDAVRTAIIEELALHPADEGGRRLVVQQAGAASSEPVKLAATKALQSYADAADATEALIVALGDPWPSIREIAQAALAPRAAAAKDALAAAAATSASHLVRAGAVRVLVLVARGSTDLEDLLLDRAVRDDAPKVREAAVTGLGSLAVARARPQLVELMRTDPDAGVRMSAERAISKLGEAGASNVVVAVLPLENRTGSRDADLERLGGEIATYVAARLSRDKVCQVVDPAKTEAAIEELKKTGVAMYDGDAPNAPAIGRFKIANQLVYGSIHRTGSTYSIVLNRIDVATLAHVPGAAVAVQGFKPDLEQLKVRAADQLVASFR